MEKTPKQCLKFQKGSRLGDKKRDFLHCLLGNFKSDNTFAISETGPIFHKIGNWSQKSNCNCQFDHSPHPANVSLPPAHQPY